MSNINTKAYWDSRFGTGDWEKRGGYSQTALFAASQIPLLDIATDFKGVICDFGCGAGDAFPFYKERFPFATLIGVDFSDSAIDLCRSRYGDIATFICGDQNCIPQCDVIITSNVLEHLDDSDHIAADLSRRTSQLYIFVPYMENIANNQEHVNAYDVNSFSFLPNLKTIVFKSPGWTLFGFQLFWQVYFKNIFRFLLMRPLRKNGLQIMFHSARSTV